LNFKSIFEISENKNSLGNQFRNKRFKFFFNKIKKLKKPVTILDVGGKINYWENRNLAGNIDYQITIVNIEKENSNYSNIKCVIGDATDLSQFKNKSFNVVHSNSVIEHLYNFKNQKKMASEIIRVGQNYLVQTPNKFFFMEPHYLIPFFQFLPNKIKYYILTNTKMSRLKKWDRKFAKQYINEIKLISLNELKILFPSSTIYYEKFYGMNKSFTVHNFKSLQ
jgi:2-polyprenyl-3-methyl-5-hydroxy-6-metoxy-1,4-benzoquinol methylase|tara:strand:+ start:326 stop:994 length:669 start_codon:yes stop_codon:yes gene_type:complete